jgi:hypothetical protein
MNKAQVGVSAPVDPARICTSHCRAQQSEHAHEPSAVHPAHERLQQEVGEPLGRCNRVVHVLQLLPSSQVASRHSCDGSQDHRSRLERAGAAGACVIRDQLTPSLLAYIEPLTSISLPSEESEILVAFLVTL